MTLTQKSICTAGLILYLCLINATAGFGQRLFGVKWQPPEDSAQIVEQLFYFQQLGITHLQIEGIHNMQTMDMIDAFDFDVQVQVPNHYPTVADLESQPGNYLTTILDHIIYYKSYDCVNGFGLYRLGQSNKAQFSELLNPLMDEIRNHTERNLWATTTFSESEQAYRALDALTYQFADSTIVTDHLPPNTGALYYRPYPIDRFNLHHFQRILQKTRSVKSLPLYLNYQWLLINIQKDNRLESVLQDFARDEDTVYPVDTASAPPVNPNWIVLFLIFLWGSFSVHYGFVPTYRKSVSRYFFNHNFFVNDIIQRRIRSPFPGYIIIIQHAFVAGMIAYILMQYTFADVGYDALIHHYPWIAYLGNSSMAFFAKAFAVTMILQVLFMVWIYLLNKDFHHFTQIVLLYAWPLQLNFITISLMVALILSGTNMVLVHICAALYVVIWISGYLLTVSDMAIYTRRSRLLFITLTGGLLMVLVLWSISWIYSQTNFVDVVQLAAALS